MKDSESPKKHPCDVANDPVKGTPGRGSRSANAYAAPPIQAKKSGDQLSDSVGSEDVRSTMRQSSGAALDAGTQQHLSAAMGVDFSNVRVHTDGAAAGAADMLGARAMTSGSDVYFGRGQYSPGTSSGQHLIAHELAHVKQQAQGRATGLSLKAEVAGDSGGERAKLEKEADDEADKATQGGGAADGEIDWSKVDEAKLGEAAQKQGIPTGKSKESAAAASAALTSLARKLFPNAVKGLPAASQDGPVQADRLKDYNTKPWGGEYSNVKVSKIPDLVGELANYRTKISRWASAMEGYSHFDGCIYENIVRSDGAKCESWSGWSGNSTLITTDILENAPWGPSAANGGKGAGGSVYRHELGASSAWFSDIEAWTNFDVFPFLESATLVHQETLPDYNQAIPLQSDGNTAIEFDATSTVSKQNGYSITKSRGQSNYLSSEITSSIGADLGVIAAKVESSIEAKKTVAKAISNNKSFTKQNVASKAFKVKIPASGGPVNKLAIPSYTISTMKLKVNRGDKRGVYTGEDMMYAHYVRPSGAMDVVDATAGADTKPTDHPTPGSKAVHDAQQAEVGGHKPVGNDDVISKISVLKRQMAVPNYTGQKRATVDGVNKRGGGDVEIELTESHSSTVSNGMAISQSNSTTKEINASVSSQLGLGESVTKATGISASVGGKISSGESITKAVEKSVTSSSSETVSISDKRSAKVPPLKKGSVYLTPLAKVTTYKVDLVNGSTVYAKTIVHQPTRHSQLHLTAKKVPHPDMKKVS